MSTTFEEIVEKSRNLSIKDRAALAHILIKELDNVVDDDVEPMWIEEAERRLDKYRSGNIEALPGEEVMARARQFLK